jgi:glycosyltransferase involved in cell wall biosynthesis
LIISTKKSRNPIVSVIVTTYNRQDYLADTISSILSQTFQDFELIIVDNCSDYDFFKFLSSFQDARIRGYVNYNDGIIAVNRNFGIEYAVGEFLAFCDDDDLWESNKLEKQLKFFLSCKSYSKVLVYTDVIIKGNLREDKRFCSEIKSKEHLLRSNQIVFSSVLVSNSKDVRFNEMLSLKGSEDCELWFRLFESGYQFYVVRGFLTKYRLSSHSVSAVHRPSNYLRLCLIYNLYLLDNRPAINQSWKDLFMQAL